MNERILETLQKVNKPLQKDALLRILNISRRQKKALDVALTELQAQGTVIRAGGGWAYARTLKTIEGVLAIQQAGMGFVTPTSGRSDIYIHHGNLGEAWHGDTVLVTLLPGKHGRNLEGRIHSVLRRSIQELPALATQAYKDGSWLCTPSNSRIPALFVADTALLPSPVHKNDLLLIVPGEKKANGIWFAHATTNLEHEATPKAQERLTKSNHSIPHSFPPAVLAEVATLPAVPHENEWGHRRDLRHLDFVTIDEATAHDFDDAIYVETTPQGFLLRVAIADVAHYVSEGSALDNEARLRGNSYYFPASVEPMLPEALSNGLCSLRPHEPRLAIIIEAAISSAGAVTRTEFYAAVIESSARLTYKQIQQAVILQNAQERQPILHLMPMLENAEALARILAQVRNARGSLDFNLPEAQIIMDEHGVITHIAPREHHFGHRLIEEFMIIANEAAARFLSERDIPFLYRTHPAPDAQKLDSLLSFLAKTGLIASSQPRSRKKTAPTPLELRAFMTKAQGTPQEYTVNRSILRAMMQARYTPEHEMHFGLASPCYCHFTSPIRRYADLLTHRALKEAIGLPKKSTEKRPSLQRLEFMANHINGTERTAMEAEREIQKRLTILYLQNKVDTEYEGIISGITDFGIFVELPSLLAEGMVRFGSLTDDYYEYIADRQELRGKHHGQTFRLGQSLRVRLTDVNLNRLEVNLMIVSQGEKNKKKIVVKLPKKR